MRARCIREWKGDRSPPAGVAWRGAARSESYPALQGVYTGNKFMANGHKFSIRCRLLLSPPAPRSASSRAPAGRELPSWRDLAFSHKVVEV